MKLNRKTIDIIAAPLIYIIVLGAFWGLSRYLFHDFGPRGPHDMRAVWAGLAIAFFFLVPVPVISFIVIKQITTTISNGVLVFVIIVFVIAAILILVVYSLVPIDTGDTQIREIGSRWIIRLEPFLLSNLD